MTKVYAQSKDGRYLLRAEGHAAGSELVCACCSGIVYSFAGYLVNAAADKLAEIEQMRLDPGDAAICVRADERIQAAFDMAVIGLKQLEQKYPQYIHVTLERETPP